MVPRVLLTVGVLVLLVAVPPGSAAQDAAPTKTERLSAWIAEKVAESQRPPFRNPFAASDDDAARATQQIEQELAELRAGFPPESLDVEGLVVFRRYERMAEIGLGKLAIERQRIRATAVLGASFDLRAFHDQVLRYGPMPLAALEEVIDRWIASSR